MERHWNIVNCVIQTHTNLRSATIVFESTLHKFLKHEQGHNSIEADQWVDYEQEPFLLVRLCCEYRGP